MPEFLVRVEVQFHVEAASEDEALDIASADESAGEWIWDSCDVEEIEP